MFDRLISFLQGLSDQSDRTEISEDDPRVAATALLLHVMDADGIRSDSERAVLRRALETGYGLDGTELDAVLDAGEQAEREAIDLYAFTSVLKRNLDENGRIEFIALMWQIVHADGETHELEDNIVWRVAELMGVDRRVRTELRSLAGGRTPTLQAVADAQATAGADED